MNKLTKLQKVKRYLNKLFKANTLVSEELLTSDPTMKRIHASKIPMQSKVMCYDYLMHTTGIKLESQNDLMKFLPYRYKSSMNKGVVLYTDLCDSVVALESLGYNLTTYRIFKDCFVPITAGITYDYYVKHYINQDPRTITVYKLTDDISMVYLSSREYEDKLLGILTYDHDNLITYSLVGLRTVSMIKKELKRGMY